MEERSNVPTYCYLLPGIVPEQELGRVMTGRDLDTLFCLTRAHVGQAGGVLARAFQKDPLLCYYIPGASERRESTHYLWEFVVHYGVLCGEVYAPSSKLEGVAVWFLPESSKENLGKEGRSGSWKLLSKLGIETVSRMKTVNKYISSIRKRHVPFHHLYLSVIGIDPSFQGRGYASRLIRPMLAQADQWCLPCYLETHDPENIPIYERYGFELVGRSRIPDMDIYLYAMLRSRPA
jgi:ribosomal protein S18 acetylase RimI-like enzyme